MKVIVTSTGADLESELDPRFGRAKWFILSDTESGKTEYFENRTGAAHGAGVQAGQLAADLHADAVVTGRVGPNALRVLREANIHIFEAPGGTVREAIDAYRAGTL